MEEALEHRLAEIEQAFHETLETMADPEVAGDQERYTEVAKRHAELKQIVEVLAETPLGEELLLKRALPLRSTSPYDPPE